MLANASSMRSVSETTPVRFFACATRALGILPRTTWSLSPRNRPCSSAMTITSRSLPGPLTLVHFPILELAGGAARPVTSDSNIGLHRDLSGSALPFILPSVSGRARISGLTGSHSLQPVRLLAPLTDLTGISPSHRSFYTQAFHDSVTLLTAGYNFDSHRTSSVDGTFTHWNSS